MSSTWCFVGVVHPAPNKYKNADNFNNKQITTTIANFKPAPVTFNHKAMEKLESGIRDQMKSRITLRVFNTAIKYLSKGDSTCMSIGTIHSLFRGYDGRLYCLGEVSRRYKVFEKCAEWKVPIGLSLTTCDRLNTLEVTLTYDPAREECYTTNYFNTLELANKYKRQIESTLYKEDETDMSSASDLVSSTMTEELATKLEKRMLEMQKMLDEQKALNETLATELENTKHAQNIDAEVLKENMFELLSHISPDLKEKFNTETALESVGSNNPAEFRRGADQVILACSTHMRRMKADKLAGDVSSTRKRPRTDSNSNDADNRSSAVARMISMLQSDKIAH